MQPYQYAILAALIFTIVAILQAARLFYGWPMTVGSTEISHGCKLGGCGRCRAAGLGWLHVGTQLGRELINARLNE